MVGSSPEPVKKIRPETVERLAIPIGAGGMGRVAMKPRTPFGLKRTIQWSNLAVEQR